MRYHYPNPISLFPRRREFLYFSFARYRHRSISGTFEPPFERFYRVDKAVHVNWAVPGRAAIVKTCVIIHGGSISAKNNQGGGLEFVFTLAKEDKKHPQTWNSSSELNLHLTRQPRFNKAPLVYTT